MNRTGAFVLGVVAALAGIFVLTKMGYAVFALYKVGGTTPVLNWPRTIPAMPEPIDATVVTSPTPPPTIDTVAAPGIVPNLRMTPGTPLPTDFRFYMEPTVSVIP